MKILNFNILCAALSMIIMLGACREDIVWSESHRLPPEGWLPGNAVDFILDPAAYEPAPTNRFAEYTARAIGDTTARIIGSYHATLSLRYRVTCNASDISLVVEKFGLNEPIATDTVTFRLFNTQGVPSGKGRLGIYEVAAPIAGTFHVKEGTTLSVRPIAYSDTITGLSDITLYLSKEKVNKDAVVIRKAGSIL